MSYSTSPVTLRRIIHEYQPLLSGRECIWYRPVGIDRRRWATRWAYKLREGLVVAKNNPEDFPEIAAISERVKVSIVNPNQVEMRLIKAYGESEAVISAAPEVHLATQTVEEGVTYSDVLTRFRKQLEQNNLSKIHFAQTSLNTEEVGYLASTLTKAGWMLLRARDGALTLAPDDPDVPAEAKVSPLERE